MKAPWKWVIFIVLFVAAVAAVIGLIVYNLPTKFQGSPSDLLSESRANLVNAGLNYLERDRRGVPINLNQTMPSPAMLYNTIPGLGGSPRNVLDQSARENIKWNPIDENLFGDNKLTF